MSSPAEWSEIERLFFAALEVPASARDGWIDTHAGTSSVADEVRSLVRAHEESEGASPLRFGPYRLERLIDRGGMGEVWLASRADGQFEQKVALKLVRAGLGSDFLLQRFHQERQLLALLNHPHIARLLDGGISADGQPYLAMEYVEGETIVDYCQSRDLPLRERLALYRELCSAVEYAHQNLIVHRDIKPANVLVTAAGVPKLLDFGIAKLLKTGSEEDGPGVTQPGLHMLTPQFASPEQARGLPVTTATDVYSLGMLLYLLLTGKMPYEFPTESAGEIERVICEVEPPPPSQRAPSAAAKKLAGDLDTIVLKALQKDPLRRYASVEQFSADIQRHLDGLPIQARPQTLIYKAGRFVRRNRISVAAAVLVALSLTGGLAAALWQARIARAERQREARRFNDVRQLAHAFLFDFHDAIQNLPGATPARHLVVDKALQYLNSLAQESTNDAALQAELAEAYLRVGELQGGLGYPNLGDSEGALRSFERALEMSRSAVRRDPRNVEWVRYLARAEIGAGDLLGVRDGPAAAVKHYQEALRAFQTIAPRVAHDMAAQFELGSIYEALGDFLGNPGLANLGDYEGAKQAYRKSLAIAQAIASEHPENMRSRRAVGIRQMKIGDVELGLGNIDAALRLYRNAVSWLEDVNAIDPVNPSNRMFLALAVGNLGQALEAAGEKREALRQYQRASGIQSSLMQADPQNEMSRNSYALSLQTQANLLRAMGDRAGAMTRYREALEIARRLSAADPTSLRRKALCGQLLTAMGAIAAETGDRQEAARRYREGLDLLKLAADRAGATADDQSNYAEQLLACPLPEFANPRQALAYARRAVDASHQSRWVYLDQVARASQALGDWAAAADQERNAIALLPPGSPKRRELEARLTKFAPAH